MANTHINKVRVWSEYQKAVFDFVLGRTNGSCVINAVAGSGKTTTILAAAVKALDTFAPRMVSDYKTGELRRQSDILFLAFNSSIVKDQQIKLENEYSIRAGKDGIDVRNLHQQGRSALSKIYYSINKQYPAKDWLDKDKWSNIIDTKAPTLTHSTFEDEGMMLSFIGNCKALFDKCRVELVYGGQTRKIEGIAEHYGIELYADEIEVVSELLKDAYKVDATNLSRIDFTDMVAIPAANRNSNWGKCIPKYKLVFVDECQDLNNAQRELLLGSIEDNGRFIAVGDRRQAINGFAGASCDSFDLLKGLAGGMELGLSVCYRCGKAQIELAKTIVPQITAFEGACDGEVRHSDRIEVKAGDMVLCRKSAPLIDLCLKLIANGIGAKVKGRDIADGLVALINKCKVKDIDRLFIALDKEVEKLRKKLVSAKVENVDECPKLVALQDKVDCIKILGANAKNATEIVDNLTRLFADDVESNFVTLSTIHKAKGLEADNVSIILPDKLPLTYKGQKDWEYEQELNLCYVAYTRAKKVLTFVDLNEEELAGYRF